jgi:hypothetical protein
MNLNKNEKNVLLAIIETCYDDYFADAQYISRACKLTVSQAKGYIGDLIKKELIASGEVDTGSEKIKGVHSFDVDGHAIGFGCDEYSKEEMLTFYKNKNVL